VPLVLAGFSQGACLAIEYLMTTSDLPDAAALFTGCRVGLPTDGLPTRDLAGLPVYASCGDEDPWIPADAYFRMLADLTGAGARLRADIFPGRPHTVTDTEIAALSGFLGALRDGTPILTKGDT
jgi:phospholipase/carboxylesterase